MGRPRKHTNAYADLYVAKEGFQATINGEIKGVAAGEIVEAGSEIMNRREDLFKPWEGPRYRAATAAPGEDERPVEAATAAPGEKRGG